MEINDSLKKAGTAAVRGSAAGAAKASAASSGTGSVEKTDAGSDAVTLSSEAKAMASAASHPAFDAKKVEEIKAAIASGTFEVNPEKVAQGLMDTVRDLIHARRK